MSAEIQQLLHKVDIHVAVCGAPKTGKATLIRHLEKNEYELANIRYYKCERLNQLSVKPHLIITVCSPDFGYQELPALARNIPVIRVMLRADINMSVIETTPAISMYIIERHEYRVSGKVLPQWPPEVETKMRDNYTSFINRYHDELDWIIATERLTRLGNSLLALANEVKVAGGDVVGALSVGLFNKSVDDLYSKCLQTYAAE